MNKLIRTTVVAVAAVAVAVPMGAATAAPAKPAAAKKYTTIDTIAKAKHQACRTLSADKKTWLISNRLDTRKTTSASGPIEATLTVTYKGKPTKRAWDSGFQKKGKVSKVVVVKFPRGDAKYKIIATIHGTDFGNGGPVSITKIGVC